MKAQEQLPRESGLALDRRWPRAAPRSRARSGRGGRGVRAEAGDRLLEQQRVGSPGSRQTVRRRPSRSLTSGGRGGSASHSATGRGSQPGCSAAPKCSASHRSASGLECSISPLPSSSTTAVPGGGSSASARTRRPRASAARNASSRPGGRDRARRGRARRTRARSARARRRPPHRAPCARRSRSRTPRRTVEQVAVQLAAGKDGGAPRPPTSAGPGADARLREQADDHRVAHDRLEGAGRLHPEGDRRVVDGARGELDAIPGQHVRGNEFGERLQRPRRSSATVRAPTIARANPSTAPTSVSASQGMASRTRIHLAERGRWATPIPPAQSDSETARHRPCGGAQTRSAHGTTRICRRNQSVHPTRFASEGLNGSRFMPTSRSSRPSASLATRGVGRARCKYGSARRRVGTPLRKGSRANLALDCHHRHCCASRPWLLSPETYWIAARAA